MTSMGDHNDRYGDRDDNHAHPSIIARKDDISVITREAKGRHFRHYKGSQRTTFLSLRGRTTFLSLRGSETTAAIS